MTFNPQNEEESAFVTVSLCLLQVLANTDEFKMANTRDPVPGSSRTLDCSKRPPSQNKANNAYNSHNLFTQVLEKYHDRISASVTKYRAN